ncbi:hypothetical protein LA5095_03146 [Roseibium album]|nr:hypothetical protein LA5095_03146 [Roseibium album]
MRSFNGDRHRCRFGVPLAVAGNIRECLRCGLFIAQVIECTVLVIGERAVGIHRQQCTGIQHDLRADRRRRAIDRGNRQAVSVGIRIIGKKVLAGKQAILTDSVAVVDRDRCRVVMRSFNGDRHRCRFGVPLAVAGNIRECLRCGLFIAQVIECTVLVIGERAVGIHRQQCTGIQHDLRADRRRRAIDRGNRQAVSVGIRIIGKKVLAGKQAILTDSVAVVDRDRCRVVMRSFNGDRHRCRFGVPLSVTGNIREGLRCRLFIVQVIKGTVLVIRECSVGIHRQQRTGIQHDLRADRSGRAIDRGNRQAVAIGIRIIGKKVLAGKQAILTDSVAVVDRDRCRVVMRSFNGDRHRCRFGVPLSVTGNIREGLRCRLFIVQVIKGTVLVIRECSVGIHRQQRTGIQHDLRADRSGRAIDRGNRQAVAIGIRIIGKKVLAGKQAILTDSVAVVFCIGRGIRVRLERIQDGLVADCLICKPKPLDRKLHKVHGNIDDLKERAAHGKTVVRKIAGEDSRIRSRSTEISVIARAVVECIVATIPGQGIVGTIAMESLRSRTADRVFNDRAFRNCQVSSSAADA